MRLFFIPFLFVLLATVISNCSGDSATFTVNTSLSSSARQALKKRDCDRVPCSGSPENLQFKIYKVYLGQQADCSDATVVSDFGDSGKLVSIGAEALIQASPPAGTYRCLVFKMSDNLRFTPDAEAVADHTDCHANTVSIFDIFRTGETWKNLDGSSINATGDTTTPGDDTVYIFGSSNVSAVTGAIGASVNQTLDLTGTLTVPGTATFYADFRDGVADISSECKIEGGTGMGFK